MRINKNLKSFSLILIYCLSLMLSACVTKNVSQKGFIFDDEDMSNITVGVTSKENVIKYLGFPLNKSYFNDNLWIYYSYQTREVLFFKPKIQNERLLVIEFNENSNRVKNISLYNIDSNKIDIDDLEIKDDYERSIIKDILRNIGQVNVVQ